MAFYEAHIALYTWGSAVAKTHRHVEGAVQGGRMHACAPLPMHVLHEHGMICSEMASRRPACTCAPCGLPSRRRRRIACACPQCASSARRCPRSEVVLCLAQLRRPEWDVCSRITLCRQQHANSQFHTHGKELHALVAHAAAAVDRSDQPLPELLVMVIVIKITINVRQVVQLSLVRSGLRSTPTVAQVAGSGGRRVERHTHRLSCCCSTNLQALELLRC